jgi:hypothetical protein
MGGLNVSNAGWEVIDPEIADYEVRRELLRANKTAGIARLDTLKVNARYLPITTEAMLLAAALWARARQEGVATAADKALDADVILEAQALTLRLPDTEIVVASSNTRHLSRFVAAKEWQDINP